MSRRSARFPVASVALALGLLAAACSGSVDEITTATSAPEADVAAQTEPPSTSTAPTTADEQATTAASSAAPTTAPPATTVVPTTAPPATAASTADGAGQIEGSAFDFNATLIGGDAFVPDDHIGRDVLVWFWAPW